jgi:hypothetical protein
VEGDEEGLGHRAHVGVLERPQLTGKLLRAEVELLVEGVDLDRAVDAVGAPLAFRAAPPDAPVVAVALLLQQVGWTSSEPQQGQMWSEGAVVFADACSAMAAISPSRPLR